jgi:hypothetical protein
MDLTVLIGGLAIALCNCMDAEGCRLFIKNLSEMADKNSISPAEAHVFRTVAEALQAGGAAARKPTLTVIQGGAA